MGVLDEIAREAVVTALLHIAGGDHSGARDRCAAALRADRGALLPRALMAYLDLAVDGVAGDVVYAEPSSFEAFIDGGDNPALYKSTVDALRSACPNPTSLLDVGCGDGRVTRSTLGRDTEHVHLVEPSGVMLAEAVATLKAVEDRAPLVTVTEAGIEVLVADAGVRSWDRAQATFALHAVRPDARPRVFEWLVARVASFDMVEFDVPPFADRSREHARYAVERYERGAAEYDWESPAVAGFLMPVLVGQFDASATRHTWEQPIAAWCDDLMSAGFAAVTHQRIHDYWWAPAHLVSGRGRA